MEDDIIAKLIALANRLEGEDAIVIDRAIDEIERFGFALTTISRTDTQGIALNALYPFKEKKGKKK